MGVQVLSSAPIDLPNIFMADSILERQENETLKLTITIPQDLVKKTRETVVEQMAKSAHIAGFRKGKAPKKIVEEKLDEAKVQEEVLKQLLPQSYVAAVQEHKLQPIMNPRIHVEKLGKDEDWQFVALTCEAPEIDLGNYKDAIKSITAKAKIIIPGKENQQKEPVFDEIVKALLDAVSVKIPQILIDQETEKLLAQTLDDIKRLGLNLDQYLSSTGRTAEQLKADYAQRAQNDITFEFALQKIAEVENIRVDDKEVDEAITKAKDEQERMHMEANRYLLTSILRQQKTLDFLKNL